MLALLYKLIIGRFGCEHRWQEYHRTTVEDWDRGYDDTGVPGSIYPMVLVKCEKCGHHKRINLK
jgi:hypothetical protein